MTVDARGALIHRAGVHTERMVRVGKSMSNICFFRTLVLLSCLFTAVSWGSDLDLFSENKSAEENRLAVIDRYGEWIRGYDRGVCNFTFYEGLAKPMFILRWFLGAALESKMHYAECSDGDNSASHILLEVISPSRPKQKFTVSMRSIAKSEDRWPYYSETTYASKGSFIQSLEENQFSNTIYTVHHKYRSKPNEVESGEIPHPSDLPNRVHTYASLMSHLSDRTRLDDTFNFVMTDPYSAAIQDEVVEYPMWRNEPLQVIKVERNEDDSINMRGWFPYAFGQLYAKINICFGESKLPQLIKYRHPFMDVDLWRSSGVPSNLCKTEHIKKKVEHRGTDSHN